MAEKMQAGRMPGRKALLIQRFLKFPDYRKGLFVLMNFALDILFVCVVVIFAVAGVRRGFIKSAAHFLGAVVSACLAAVLGGFIAQWIYGTLFRNALVEKIETVIGSFGGADAVQSTLSSLPDFIVRALEEAGVTGDTLAGEIAVQSGETAELLAAALEPVFVGFLKVLCVIALFLLLMVLVRVLAHMLSTVFELPVLNQFNSLLGGVFGFLLGIVSLWIAIAALRVFVPMLSADMQLQLEDSLRRSAVAGALVNFNPFTGMFR